MWETTPVWHPTCTAQSSVERSSSSSDVSGADVNPHPGHEDAPCRIDRKVIGAVHSCILCMLKLQAQGGQITDGVKSAIWVML